ncbi:MAG TPA: hypothetical protein H9683_05775 [Firmicutes bacterium]|nr:hypothetical protein [Bacillota bacterium]
MSKENIYNNHVRAERLFLRAQKTRRQGAAARTDVLKLTAKIFAFAKRFA